MTTFVIEESRDRENNTTYEVSIIGPFGGIVAHHCDYTETGARQWVEKHYPNATED